MKFLKSLIITILSIAVLSGLVFSGMWLITGHFSNKGVITVPHTKQTMKLVSLGDSLTEGVGDTTNKGGFVPLISAKIDDNQNIKTTTSNFGLSGDRSDQIYDRLKQQPEMQKTLSKATAITLTVGGNDLLQVIQKNILSNDASKLTKAINNEEVTYLKKLEELFKEIRKYNPDAPIYTISVYNPFYVYFPSMSSMTTIVQSWNNTTKKVIKTDGNSYFVDVAKQLSEGQYYGKKSTLTKTADSSDLSGLSGLNLEKVLQEKDEKNDYISVTDHFHPNNKGYEKMTELLYKSMQENHLFK
ncbi:SGNH/GDSL hydrolase family protein [Dellaglioa algida]|uniref:Lipase/acylhydrolase n=1 Tax=Dellaglioa algida TaxID=105612 RepID=A0A2C8EKT1_9LACO|nr:SGNH/GDSL hydrolase family protein [Dellaglioa algida]MDK1716526.1 SGNH/GDSL hydrolase family protein [Dellaglioa algida]MDK1718051.1 SGNH/GDSL hydrolase family protein [Dellaglioa algida]MDK1719981.1 SGNH/GDSL hydrolase family protein [Dellaglioa algida]MDK1721468.1 SGNH/GDSL hydrolase family protein [Dellaglioa algida]MDK1723310.1 SGNH/GDSL hydrolase family protein [Dellaglioa algida]